MANIKRKIELLSEIVAGNLLKCRINFDLHVRKRISLSSKVEPTVMVSLTSYGHRLRHSVQYTLYSMLKQDVRPAKIVLWTDAGEFTNEPMPQALQVLQKYGVEIREYAPKIRSYKKLIPSLKEYPDFHHIIVDDDLYYSSNFVQALFDGHLQHPDAIIALATTIPEFSEDGASLLPYRCWKHHVALNSTFEYRPMSLLQLGYGGVFYPQDTFDEEVLNEAVFSQLCPIADDLWFYIQSIRMQRPKHALIRSGVKYSQIDLIRQFLSRDRLTQSNKAEGQNDIQLRQLLEHYQIDLIALK
ncbi:MAG: hypothetical protein J6T38_08335 [Bacteroidaceae bacterium]|nr:hypothetical protein [Bacteroidaceae bacterium]